MSQIQLVPRSAMESMPWWNSLTASEKRTVMVETQELTEAMETHGLSKLAIGEHLVKLRDILEPKRRFTSYIRYQFPTCSLATCYRWIDNFQIAKEKLPENFMRAAMAQGYHVIDADIVDKLPPPRTQDRKKITAYLAKLKTAKQEDRSQANGAPVSPNTLMRECFNFVASRIRRLPNNERSRTIWLQTFVGMLLTEFGSSEERSFSPVEVPSDVRAVRGRPRIVA